MQNGVFAERCHMGASVNKVRILLNPFLHLGIVAASLFGSCVPNRPLVASTARLALERAVRLIMTCISRIELRYYFRWCPCLDSDANVLKFQTDMDCIVSLKIHHALTSNASTNRYRLQFVETAFLCMGTGVTASSNRCARCSHLHPNTSTPRRHG